MPTDVKQAEQAEQAESADGSGTVLPWEERWPDHVGAGQWTGLRGALRDLPPGLTPGWRRVLVGLVVVQLVVIAVLATMVAFEFKIFSPVDEEAHFSYVQQIAQHGTLPVLGKTPTSPQALAVEEGTYPRPATRTYSLTQLQGLSYEALQPPLYYIAAVPAFDLTSNYVDKVYSLRLFDVVLLLATLVCLGRLARVVLQQRWMIGWAVGLVFFALPGVVVRFVTVSNLALAVPLVLLFVTELWIGWDRHSGRRLTLAGLFLGLSILAELEQILLVPVFALVVVAEGVRRMRTRIPTRGPGLPRASRVPTRKVLAPLAAAVLVPIVVTAPWFLFNEANYHMLTAGPIAITEQTPTVNPHHLRYSIGQLPNDTVNFLLDPTIPEEWVGSLGGQPALNELDLLVSALIIPGSLVMIAGLGRRLRSVRVAILGLPWVVNILELWCIRYGEQWLIAVRYTFATVPILLVLGAGATLCALRSRILPILVPAAATASVLIVWGFFLWSYTGTWALT